MDIAVIGTGAIGGYYGARLATAGHRVHFWSRSEHAHLTAHGLTVDSCLGDFSLEHPLAYARIDQMPPCDVVLVTIKATANDQVFDAIGPVVKPGSQIVLMQNGFGNEPVLAALYPQARIYAGLCFICSFRDGPGVVRHTAYGNISLASLLPDAAGLAELAGLFNGAGVETQVIGQVVEARLRKLVWNLPFNGLTVVLNATTEDIAASPPARAMAAGLMAELLEAAQACGSPIEPAFADQMLATIDPMGPYNPSMRLDFLAGRPMEIDAMYWNVIRYAAQHGYDMRAATLLARQLEHRQAARDAARR
ncbi:MAG: 2-dehydropantoate 2-reductase [Bifidobacteriaceae bacterium]|nr:2-dehydropantoate 2-reductase [Bifidobacteriaceae bacterium]